METNIINNNTVQYYCYYKNEIMRADRLGALVRGRLRRFVVVAKTSLLRSVTGLPYGRRWVLRSPAFWCRILLWGPRDSITFCL